MYRRSLIPVLLLVSVVGCDDAEMDSSGAGTSGGEPGVDEAAIAEQAVAFESLEKINDEPLQSQHGLASTMNMWVDAAAAPAYASLGAGTAFDPDTIILKEQLNADGELDSIAVMYKGPAGYAPDAGDWWFGLVNPDGSVRLGGQPDACVSCHADASDQDWAWGLPGGG